MIHFLLGDSYGCVNHACGAIDPLSRVEYKPVSPPLVLKKLRIREENISIGFADSAERGRGISGLPYPRPNQNMVRS